MLNVSDELKLIYKNDVIPAAKELAFKELFLYFPSIGLTISNDKIYGESMRLEESICDDENLTFGACEASQFSITVTNIEQELKGLEMVVTQRVNGLYTVPLGTYFIESAKKRADEVHKDIVAIDYMTKTDVDVIEWYNGLNFNNLTQKQFRESLLTYLGLEFEDQTLINDDITITKTIETNSLIGKEVLMRIGELNGVFGQMSRYNKFKYVGLGSYSLYPSEELYPSESLFPSENSDCFSNYGYKKSEFEEYTVKPITKIEIVKEDGEIGVITGSGDNRYKVSGNFLVYDKTTQELTTISKRLLLAIGNIVYRPHKTQLLGIPYIEPGDFVTIVANNDVVETFVLKRVLTGLQALNDEVEAKGTEVREEENGIQQQLEKLNNNYVKIRSDLEGLTIEITGDGGLSSKIVANAESILAEVERSTKVEGELSTAIKLTAEGLETKVNKNGIISTINQSAESVTIDASKINLTGYVTVTGLKNGTTTIDGGCIKTGTIESIDIILGNSSNGVIKNTAGKKMIYTDTMDQLIFGEYDNYLSNIRMYSKNMSIDATNSVDIMSGAEGTVYVHSGNGAIKITETGLSMYHTTGNISISAGGAISLKQGSTTYGLDDMLNSKFKPNELFADPGSTSSSYLVLNSSRELVPTTPSTSTPLAFSLGTSYSPFDKMYVNNIYHRNGKLGLFGTTPVTKKTVSKLGSSPTLANVATKLNDLITALNGYGMIGV